MNGTDGSKLAYAPACRYDELLVGAPMYTMLDDLSPEQGRVYVFFNTGVNIIQLL